MHHPRQFAGLSRQHPLGIIPTHLLSVADQHDVVCSQMRTDMWTSARSNYRCCSRSNSYSFSHPVLILHLFYSQVGSSLASDVNRSLATSTKLYTGNRTFHVRLAAAICAGVSVVTLLLAFHWFYRMEKRFRHRLVMLLIYGDLVRASWLFIHALVSIAMGTIHTESAFCQSSGFFVQYGTETSDYAVLAIAVHSAIQVFWPSTLVRSDGLYPYRYYVYIGALILPATMATLAFINPRFGYMSQGAFCSLPLRPFWYRLALAWIPRYVIAIIIMGLAVAIYTHVGFEFRSFSQTTKASISTTTPVLSTDNADDSATEAAREMMRCSQATRRRRSSVISFVGSSEHPSVALCLGGRTIRQGEFSIDIHRSHSVPDLMRGVEGNGIIPFPDAGCNNFGTTSPTSHNPTVHATCQIEQQRARIHKQLRLMFIYPVIYILMWVVPFIGHCMTYYDEWAKHPVYALNLASTVCVALMGAVDCLVFSLRERPWGYISSSDGTFWGSFTSWRKRRVSASEASMCRRFRSTDARQRALTDANPETPLEADKAQSGVRRSAARASRSVRTSGGSDSAKAAAELAHMRLEMEKEDRRREMNAGRTRNARDVRRNTQLDVIESPGDELTGFGAGDEWEKSEAGAEDGVSVSDYGDESSRQSGTESAVPSGGEEDGPGRQ